MRQVIYCVFMLLIAGSTQAHIDIDDVTVAQSLHNHFAAVQANAKPAPTLRNLTLAQAVAQFYATRNDAPAWRDKRLVEQLLNELDNLRGDGLEPEDYHLSELRERYAQLARDEADVKQITDFDVLASTAYLRSLAHLFRGKVNPATLDTQWNFALHDMTVAEALTIVDAGISNGDIHAVYERARPQHPLYLRARNALAQLRLIAELGGWPRIDTKTVLKPGVVDPSIAALRKRFLPNATDTPPNGNDVAPTTATAPSNTGDSALSDVYDDALVAAVKKFQREQYLDADGVIGASTRAVLNVPIQQRIDQMRVNLERERWLFHELQNDFVLVDIAGYKIYFFRNSQLVWQSQVQVGKPARQTPVFKAKITHVTFNPTWTVPPTILRKDVLPKLKNNLDYLAKNNIRVLDDHGRELDPKTIDWKNPGDVTLRQDAGDDAALGQVAIRFPNPYSVYLHDTPHRDLFSNNVRAFSSGCIRVARPLELVELLFNDPEKWNQAAIEQFIAQGETRNVNLPKPVPILLAYWTIDLFSDGDIGFKPDIYDRDPAVLKALNAKL